MKCSNRSSSSIRSCNISSKVGGRAVTVVVTEVVT